MADTGNSIATRIQVTDTNGTFDYPAPLDVTANELVENVNSGGNGQTITLAQAQQWLIERVRDCSGKPGTNCDDCLVCDEAVPPNEFYRSSNVDNVIDTNRLSIVNGRKVCRSSIIY